ncbi:MAG TPA: pyridoxamine 5'-phosphate oxidase family protein [Verrucomicrobiae bacterium]|jgi:nitroimidazol reductase NimA-like FMN-containing flavoprotein (pyridoxamine 5'-phosphate oxidase superfamily)|nr:pyridoxamine 5'-phosphate oxidase family protein [Verrucomicrobiae bacterium]
MTAELDRSNKSLEVLSESQCRELLASRDLGRIAFSIGGQPEILPINYAADGSVVVFRTAPDTIMLRALNTRVAFEVDGWDPQTRVGWSVVLKGIAEEVSSGIDPFSAALRERPVFPLAPGSRERWIAIYPAEISGRRFRLG